MRFVHFWWDLKNRITFRRIIELLGFVALLYSAYLALNWFGIFIQGESIQALIEYAGPYGLIIYALINLISIVIAPVPGFPAYIVTLGIYGVWTTVILTYVLSMIGATLNFLIARNLGVPIMRRLIGVRGEAKVQKHAESFGTEVLILTRLFDGFLFEWISYAAGLTSMSFRRYITITAWASIPYYALLLVFALTIHELGKMFIVVSVVNYILLGIPVIYYFVKHNTFYRKLEK